jgi:hypothetical protein
MPTVQEVIQLPRGEERVFPAALALSGARLRTMLRIALRTTRPLGPMAMIRANREAL